MISLSFQISFGTTCSCLVHEFCPTAGTLSLFLLILLAIYDGQIGFVLIALLKIFSNLDIKERRDRFNESWGPTVAKTIMHGIDVDKNCKVKINLE